MGTCHRFLWAATGTMNNLCGRGLSPEANALSSGRESLRIAGSWCGSWRGAGKKVQSDLCW